VSRLVQPLLDLRDGGFLIFFVVFGLLFVVGTCFQVARAFRRALKIDPLTYADSKPPTFRRVIYAICCLTIALTFFPHLVFQEYFVFHRPRSPRPAEHRTCALSVHGTTVYLTPQEHVLVSNNWMAVFFGCFFILVTIRMDGDPFGSEFGDVRVESLPKSVLKTLPADWPSGMQIFLIISGYFAALLTLLAVLDVRAFVEH
jgi:hypothetical protein